MRVVKAERWHLVETSQETTAPRVGAPPRRCSVCGSPQLAAPGETVLDAATLARYRVVRCGGCGYDLLEPLPAVALAAQR